MKPPIFIVCSDGDVLAYEDPERALKYVESPDVESGEYLAVFDSEGRRFNLEVTHPSKKRKWFFSSIEIVPVVFRALEDRPSATDELRTVLLERFPESDRTAPLSELVSLAAKKLPSP